MTGFKLTKTVGLLCIFEKYSEELRYLKFEDTSRMFLIYWILIICGSIDWGLSNTAKEIPGEYQLKILFSIYVSVRVMLKLINAVSQGNSSHISGPFFMENPLAADFAAYHSSNEKFDVQNVVSLKWLGQWDASSIQLISCIHLDMSKGENILFFQTGSFLYACPYLDEFV